MSQLLTTEFEKCRPQWRSYILRMTASVEDTEDIVQDTYIKAFSNMEQGASFRNEKSFNNFNNYGNNSICFGTKRQSRHG